MPQGLRLRFARFFGGGRRQIFSKRGLTKGGKCAMIKVRGNTGDGCSLRSFRNNRQSVGARGGYFFLFCMSSTNLITASTKVQSRRNSSKVKYTVITSLRSCPKEGKKFSHPPESEEATATVWVFPSLRIPRSTFYYTRKFLPCQALSKKIPSERSEGKNLEAPPQTSLRTSSRKKLQEPQSFTAKGTRNAVRNNHVPPHGCPLR